MAQGENTSQGQALLGVRVWGGERGWVLKWPGNWSCPTGEGAEGFMIGVVLVVDGEEKAVRCMMSKVPSSSEVPRFLALTHPL